MQPTTHAEGKTILVVDDDPDIRQVLCEAFESEGFRVATAVNGMQALHRVRDAAPDAIVLDISMPIMGGDDFLYAWRAGVETLGVPVVAISAAYTTLRPSAMGVEAFFPKPFDIDLLVRHVTDLLALRPPSADAADHEDRSTELDATVKELSKVLSAVLGGVEAVAADPAIPPHLHVVTTATLGSMQRAAILVRRLRHLASTERRTS